MMNATRSDCYDYNRRKELTNAVKNATLNEYAYQYDDIGNRLSSLDLGEGRQYESNNLNQYVSIAESEDEFTPQFDDDGNQMLVKTSTGIWQVAYNGENRPVSWTCGATNITMKYDRMGRRVEYLETVTNNTGGPDAVSITTNSHHRFVYDGYLCIQRLNAAANNSIDLAFGWDPAEPVATRPLWMQRVSGTYNFFYFHDGNKNVSDLVSYQSARGVPAHYEYAPFGAVTTATTNTAFMAFSVVEVNPFRFSSEYSDDALGLVYYNYRHYEPLFGRWINRDMMEDEFGIESKDGLFVSFSNDPVGVIDVIGLAPVSYEFTQWESRNITKPVGGYDKKGRPRGNMRKCKEKYENCTLTVRVRLNLNYRNDFKQKNLIWTKKKKKEWEEKAKSEVEGYFNSLSLKCYATDEGCKMCKDGVAIKLELAFTTGAIIDVSNDPNSQSCINGRRNRGHLDVADVEKKRKVTNTDQVPIVHEIGHILGLDHPGGVSNSIDAYKADVNSLMGGGMEMRPHDFDKAFCSKIKASDFGYGSETSKCKKWKSR